MMAGWRLVPQILLMGRLIHALGLLLGLTLLVAEPASASAWQSGREVAPGSVAALKNCIGDEALPSVDAARESVALGYDVASSDAVAARGGGRGGEFSRGGPPREPGTGNFVPDPDATGAHTTLGTRVGSDGKPYTQGATFDGNGNFQGRTDVTNHGRADHTNPHFHPATGPNSANSPAQPIPDE